MLTDLATAGLFKPQGQVRNLPAVAAALTQHYRHVAQFVMLHILPALGLAMLYRATDHWELALTSEGHTWLRGALRRKALWDAPPADAAVELSVPEPDQPWPSPSADFPPLVITTAPEGPAIVCRYPATAPAVLTYHLAHIATPVVWPPLHPAMTQWAAQYRLTAASMARAAAWGYTPAQIIALLGQFSGGELPPAALGHLRTHMGAKVIF